VGRWFALSCSGGLCRSGGSGRSVGRSGELEICGSSVCESACSKCKSMFGVEMFEMLGVVESPVRSWSWSWSCNIDRAVLTN
jgi:hypothetical protein